MDKTGTGINDRIRAESLALADLMEVWKSDQSDHRAAALTLLRDLMQTSLTFGNGDFVDYTTQRNAPIATGFSVTLTDGDDDDANIHLILTPSAGFANGTLVYPAVGSLIDKQRIMVNITQAVTTLAHTGSGSTIVGAPTSITANDFFVMKFDLALTTFYRVG